MTRAALVLLGAGIAGFAVGFIFGASTREALPGATSTSYKDGKLTVTVDTAQALREGLRAFIG